jgi:pimeloyl-ACP methyl ester carboxylesterase
MILKFQNIPVHYTTQGKGNPLILLHGFLESLGIWEEYQQELSKFRQVVCIDLPGHGSSGSLGELHSMEFMAGCVKAVMDELEIAQANLAGHSMGGYVNLEFQKNFNSMCKALILINSTPAADSQERQKNRDRASNLVRKNKKAFVSMAIGNLLGPENSEKFKNELESLKQRAYKFESKGIIAALQGMKIRTDNSLSLKQFEGKKIIIAGKSDPVLDYSEVKNLASRCGCEFISYKGEHLAFIEQREKLMKIMHFID